MFELIFICLLTGIAAGVIGASKGRSGFGWFLIGFFLNLIGVLIAIGVSSNKPVVIAGMSGDAARRPNDLVLCFSCNRPRRVDSYACPSCGATKPDPHAGQKKCYACAEWILKDAIKCRHCGEMQAPTSWSPPPAAPHFVAPDGAGPGMGYCAGCGKLRHSSVAKCVYCRDMAPVLIAPSAAPAAPVAASAESINWGQVDRPDRNTGRTG